MIRVIRSPEVIPGEDFERSISLFADAQEEDTVVGMFEGMDFRGVIFMHGTAGSAQEKWRDQALSMSDLILCW